MLLRLSEPREAVHRLWDELGDFGPADIDGALGHLLRTTAELVDAQNAWWLGAVRVGGDDEGDPLGNWRPGTIRYLHPSPVDVAFYSEAERLLLRGSIDESVRANVRGSGTFRVNWLPEMVPPAWYDSAFYRLAYQARGVHDAVFVCCPVNPDAEGYLGYQRKGDRPRFSAEERALLGYALRGLRWFHRRLLLDCGLLVARQPLTATERRVVRLLLTGLSERKIAAALGLALPTTHNHVTRIFRKYGVTSRAALMALWLGRAS